MQQVHVLIHHVDDTPEGLPAIWTTEECTHGLNLELWLRSDLPPDLVSYWRLAAILDACPDVSFDSFTITTDLAPVQAVPA